MQNAAWCEFRFDLLYPLQDELLSLMHDPLKKIFAVRQPSIDNPGFHDFFIKALKYAPAYVDFDSQLLGNPEIVQMIRESRTAGAEIIFSYHDFVQTPSLEFLEAKIHDLFQTGADVVKIVTLAASEKDSSRIMALYERFERLIAFGMGEEASYTRAFSLLNGEKLTYVSPDHHNAIAPGQYSLSEMKTLLSLLLR